MTIQVEPLAAALGAEVSGVDLAAPLSDEQVAAIRAAWLQHLVLLFRGQRLTHEQHVAFSRRFGALDDHGDIWRFRHPTVHEILPVDNPVMNGRRQPVGRQWHSDLATTQRPALGSILRSEVIPPVGGDTMFCNMYRALETLSPTLQRVLEGLHGVHDVFVARHNRGRDPAEMADERRKRPPIAHPMVRVHPETGRKSLYVGEMTTASIHGMTVDESAPLLQYLFAHATRPELTFRHRWRPHDVLMWDNRCVNHLALDDYDLEVPRVMYRTTILGERSGFVVD